MPSNTAASVPGYIDGNVKSSPLPTDVDTSSWVLSFADDFSGPLSAGIGGQSTLWRTDVGDGSTNYSLISHTQPATHDLEVFVDPSWGLDANGDSINPFTITNGVLDISTAATPGWASQGLYNYKFTSGQLSTMSSFAQVYGYFEASMELPSGAYGAWPAFWLYSASGNRAELDVMEGSSTNNWFATIHDPVGGATKVSTAFTESDLSTSFHTYAVLWTPTTITWYFDGQAVASTPTPADFNVPMFMVLDDAVYGSASSSFSGASLQVAYVHAYRLGDIPTSVTIERGVNNVTAVQAQSLAATTGYTLPTGATLVVEDTPANLTANGNAAGLALAASVIADVGYSDYVAGVPDLASLSVAPSLNVTGAPVSALATLEADSRVVKFSITDSAANIAANLGALAGATDLSSITLSDSGTPTLSISYAQYVADAAVLGEIVTGFQLSVSVAPVSAAATLQADTRVATFGISDTAGNLLAQIAGAGLASDTDLVGVSLTGANTVTAAQAESLAGLPGFSVGTGATLVIADTPANLTASANSGGLAFATSVVATVGYADYSAGLPDLASLKVTPSLSVSGAPVSALATLENDSRVIGFSISDSAADVAAKIDQLAGATALSAIVLTDSGTPTLTITYSQFATDSSVLGKIASTYSLAIVGSAASVAGGLNALAAITNLSSITLTDTGTPTLAISYAEYLADAATLGKITGSYRLDVGAAPVSAIATLEGDSRVAAFTTSDSAANVLAQLGSGTSLSGATLTGANTVTAAQAESLAGISGLSFASGATLTVEDSPANLTASANAAGLALATKVIANVGYSDYTAGDPDLAALTTSPSLNVTGAPVSALATLEADNRVVKFSITDNSANVVAAINSLSGAGDLSAVVLTDTGTPTLAIGYARYLADASVLGLIAGSFKLAVSAAPASAAATLQADTRVTGFTISDSATNLLALIAGGALANDTDLSSVSLTGTNTVSAAQAESLAGLPGFSLASGATLVVEDTPANLLSSADAAGLALATGVELTAVYTVSAAQASALAALNGFSIGSSAALIVLDTATDLLAPASASGLSFANTVILVGSNTVSAAQAETLAKLPGFNRASGGTLVIEDTAANILSLANAAGLYNETCAIFTGNNTLNTTQLLNATAYNAAYSLAPGATLTIKDTLANLLANQRFLPQATSVVLTASATATAAQALILANCQSFTLPAGVNLVVQDNEGNLINPATPPALAIATSVILSGSAVSTAANAEKLSQISRLSIASGTTLTVKDTLSNLLASANAGGLALATAVTLVGASIATAAQAQALAGTRQFTLAAGATLTIEDSPAAILASANAGGLALATAVTLVGTNVATAAQAESLIGLAQFSLASGATLVVQDGATNLLSSAYASGLARATSIKLTGANTVNAATVTQLVALRGFGLVSGATLIVADSAANLLSATASLTRNTGTVVTGSNTVTVSQIATLVALPVFSLAAGATLAVQDSLANVLANTKALARATSVTLSGGGTITAAQASTLAVLPGFGLASGVTLVVQDSATNLLNAIYFPALSVATSVILSATSTVTAAQAEKLAGLNHFALASGVTLTVQDSLANILASANAAGLAVASAVKLTGASTVSAAQATTLASLHGFALGSGASLVVEDTPANLTATANAAGLALATKVIANVGYADYLAGLPDLASLKTKPSLCVSAAPVSALTNLETNSRVVGFSISDTAANVTANLGAFASSELSAITLTDGGTPTLAISYAQYLADAAALGKITSSFQLNVSAAPASAASTLEADTRVTSFTISDTAANLLTQIGNGSLSGVPALAGVTLTGANTVTAAQAQSLTTLPGFTVASGATLLVEDSAANLLAATGLSQATGVELTGANTVTAAQAQSLASLPGFSLAVGATLVVEDYPGNLLASTYAAGLALATSVEMNGVQTVSAAQAAALAALPGFSLAPSAALTIADSTTGILSAANAAGLPLASTVKLTGSNTVSAAQAETLANLPGFSLASGASLVIEDNATNILAAANAAGLLDATGVLLSGGNVISIAQLATLAALPGFSLASGATLAVQDSLANVLANTGSLTLATSVSLTSGGTISALQAQLLASLPGFGVGSGVTLVVEDTAADLLNPTDFPALSFATSVLLSGANSVTAAQAETLAGLNQFALASGATLVVQDSLAAILANTAGVALATAVTLSGANIATAAQAQSLTGLPYFSLASGATLVVEDSAANLLSTANAAGLAAATGVELTGANTVSASQAASLVALPGFGFASGATLVVQDSLAAVLANIKPLASATSVLLTGGGIVTLTQALQLIGLPGFALGSGVGLIVEDNEGNLLNPANAPALAIATSVLLPGNTVSTAANAEKLSKMSQFGLAPGATLTIKDTLPNILASANAAGLALATAVTLTSANVATAAQAQSLTTLPQFTLAAGTTLGIRDTLANILASTNAAGLALATAVTLTSANVATAAQAEALTGLPQFSLASGTTLLVEDSAANLLSTANAAGIAIATGVRLTGANSVTAAQATALNALRAFGFGTGATLIVTDNATNLLAATASLGKDAATILTGSNTVNLSQATALAALPGFSLASGATLSVKDSLSDILSATYAKGLAFATAVTLTGANVAAAAQAQTISTLPQFSLASGATLTIKDTLANILASANSAGLALATTVTLTGANIATAAQAESLTRLAQFSLASGSTLLVEDSAANLLLPTNAAGLAAATGVKLTGANTVTAAQATSLVALVGFGLVTGATLIVTDTAANLLSAGASLARDTGTILTGSNTVNASQATTLVALTGFSLASGATLAVQDSLANVLANTKALARATSVTLTSGGTVTAAQALTLVGLPGFTLGSGVPLVISDSIGNLLNTGDAPAFAVATSVLLAGNNTATAANAEKLSKISQFSFASGATLTLADSLPNILASTNVAGLALATTVTLTGANIATAAQAKTLSSLPQFGLASGATLAVNDNAANISQTIDTLQHLFAKSILSAINVTQSGSNTLVITASQYANDAGALSILHGTYTLDVVGSSGQTITALTSGMILNASAGNESVATAAGGDTVLGGASDIITGNNGTNLFEFGAGFGLETLNGFVATGTNHDTLQFSKSLFSTYASLLGATVQQGSNVVITFDSNDKVTLNNVSLSSLSQTDFKFV